MFKMKLRPLRPRFRRPADAGLRTFGAPANALSPRSSYREFYVLTPRDRNLVRITFGRIGLSRFDTERGRLQPMVTERIVRCGTGRAMELNLTREGALALWAALEEALFPEQIPEPDD